MSINYTFEALNDKEFEELAIDLLSKKLNTDIERFKPGKDQGIDGRFFNTDNSQTVIQCKHYLKSGIKLLISDLEKKELPKIKKLSPARYIVVTSCPLSPMEKTSIKTKLSPYILSEADIFGKENLNDLLKQYPEIETAHYKLWLTSTNVVHSLLNNALLGRSKYHLQNTISKQSKFLVQTEHYPKALKIIQKQNTIIITGSPGVGKTTLANQLSLYLVNEGYEFYYIDEDIKEAEGIFQEGKKQLFYFDDFLGSNILEAINTNNRDSKIIRFIERIKNSGDKKFILTSRAHILNQQITRNECYHHAQINRNKYELEIAKLSDLDKAKILYNRIWHSNLPTEFIDEIYENERYKLIINHPNYNPRMIEFITDHERLDNIEPKKYWEYIQSALNNPEGIWKQVIEHDVQEIHKYLLLATTLNKNHISEQQLYNFYEALIHNHPELHIQKNYQNTITPLLDSLLHSYFDRQNNKFYTLFNPSIADYFFNNYLSDHMYLTKINLYLDIHKYALYLKELATRGTHAHFLTHKNNITISSSLYKKLVNEKILQFNNKSYTDDRDLDFELYYLSLHSQEINLQNHHIKNYLTNLTKILLNNIGKYETTRLLQSIYYLVENYFIQVSEENHDLQLIINFYLHIDIEYYEYIELSKIIDLYKFNQTSNIQHFKDKFFKFLLNEELVHEYAVDDDVLSGIYEIEEYKPHLIEDWITNSLLDNTAAYFTVSEIDALVNSVDVELIINNNIDRDFTNDDYSHTHNPNISIYRDNISDLFQRD